MRLSRLLVYVFMFVATYIFLSLVPENKRWYTNVGAKTLCVYLLHLFIIRAFESTWLMNGLRKRGTISYYLV